MTTCQRCEADLPDGLFLCATDAGHLARALHRVPDVLATARDTFTNQSVGGASVGGGGATSGSAAPLNLQMMEDLDQYEGVLRGWAGTLAEHLQELAPRRPTALVAAWLTNRLPNIVGRDWAADLLAELWDAERAIIRTADRHTPKVTLGTCGELTVWDDGSISHCDGTVKARENDHRARCDTCHKECDARERQATAVANAWHVIAPLPRVVRALNEAGYPVKYDTAKKWVARGKLHTVCDVATREEGVSPAAVLALIR